MSATGIPDQRAVIDRRALAESIAVVVAKRGAQKARLKVVELLKAALEIGRAELARRLVEQPSAGYQCAHGHAFLIDQLIRVMHDHVIADVFPAPNRTAGQHLALIAVGGYGRGEMAPHSDVDIAFVTPAKSTPWCEQVIEAIL
jgi:[protein-PII] uridylyltransferase